MAVDKSAIAAQVASLTADLQLLPGTKPQDLDEARASLALAIACGRVHAAAAPCDFPLVVPSSGFAHSRQNFAVGGFSASHEGRNLAR